MPTEQKMMYCKHCGRKTLHLAPRQNNVLHFLISFFTLGLWLLVWLIIAATRGNPQCSVCGTSNAEDNTAKGCLNALLIFSALFIGFVIYIATLGDEPKPDKNQSPPVIYDPPSKKAESASIKPSARIIDWSVSDAVRSESGNFVTAIARVKIKNSANASGHFKVILHGLDAKDYPVYKERLDIETFIDKFGTIQDAEELTFYARDWDRIKKWEIIVEPRGY